MEKLLKGKCSFRNMLPDSTKTETVQITMLLGVLFSDRLSYIKYM
jgi:hypothetical protein